MSPIRTLKERPERKSEITFDVISYDKILKVTKHPIWSWKLTLIMLLAPLAANFAVCASLNRRYYRNVHGFNFNMSLSPNQELAMCVLRTRQPGRWLEQCPLRTLMHTMWLARPTSSGVCASLEIETLDMWKHALDQSLSECLKVRPGFFIFHWP